jgi:15,16-dihydrobiliverdin:ferredoxin oxidoreductase
MRISLDRSLLLLVSLSLLLVDSSAWTGSVETFRHNAGSSGGSRSTPRRRSGSTARNSLSMDSETPSVSETKFLRRHKISLFNFNKMKGLTSRHEISVPRELQHLSVQQAEHSHGMPWKTSIDSTYTEDALFYMPFWEWQMSFMKENLTNLRAISVTSEDGKDMSYVENTDKKIRMHTIKFQSDEYKCIRMTVYDAGNATQVFTSLWYPDPAYNLPVLGIDLLQFNKMKHLCIVDFQPIQTTEAEHDRPYEHLLKPIRDQYTSLQGKMTKKFYDENQFFSKQMLFGRHDATTDGPPNPMVFDDLFPAFQNYLKTHVSLVKSTARVEDRVPAILERHAAYDSYSAVRDPAHGLLARSFGQEWADDYVYDVLFPASAKQIIEP